GFIDTHSHADGALNEQPEALAAVSQGITTVVVGQDGWSNFPLADYFEQREAEPAAVNLASFAGHGRLRAEVMGDDYKRIANMDEVLQMADLLQLELDAGALGLGSGLEYDPGIYADRSEVLHLAWVAAENQSRYISHLRSEDRNFEDAVDEIIEIGRRTRMPVQISHIKLAMKRLWGTAPELLAKLDAARADGIDISADIYPYEFWQSDLSVILPERDFTDREAVEFALDQIAPPDGMWLSRFEPEPDYVGKTLSEIAELRDVDPATAYMQLIAESHAWSEEHGESSGLGDGADAIIATSMREEDIRLLLAWPHTNVCTDGALDDRHPRGAGAFPKVLGRYVREEGLLSLEQAIHKMTGLSAQHMGLTTRGVIHVGAFADLVLFDPDTIIDKATPQQPDALSTGISAVWVNGVAVYRDGRSTGKFPGRVVRRGE
ncbi:MAG: amidohydrolase family protein, partial [Xanthomonadales bacterium]|nr:amidohydrolase family protein [Xanthomonadales bacterium]